MLLVIAFSVLFLIEARNHNYDYKKSWTVVYFNNPGDSSLGFTIENHQGEETEYGYEIFLNDKKIAENEIKIDAGAKQTLTPDLNAGGGKVTIEVDAEDLKYMIYKDIK
jgi:hypothetical protein